MREWEEEKKRERNKERKKERKKKRKKGWATEKARDIETYAWNEDERKEKMIDICKLKFAGKNQNPLTKIGMASYISYYFSCRA